MASLHSTFGARAGRPGDRSGFALLITITLLAFIVVLLLGLAVYTRVETSVASNTQRQAQARENALLALNVAVGQLQLHAGPDTRVTATAKNFGGINGTQLYTGVWSSNTTETGTPGTPRTWLVSGNELRVPDKSEGAAAGSTVPAPLAITPAAPGNRTVELVGRNTTGAATRNADYVIAPLTDVTSTGVPGVSPIAPPAVIGRYAWWVGDQGVKAPVAVADTSDGVNFAPYDSADLRSRIRQQIALGAGAADGSSGNPIVEPRDAANATLVANQKVLANTQLAFLRTASNTQVGLARVQQNVHAWSPNNFAVLANTKLGGLRQDLSLDPTLLGAAFAAWANYPAYMEKLKADAPVEPPAGGESTTTEPTTTTSTSPSILPPYGDDPLRRRYTMTPQVFGGNGSHQIAPVLTHFGITFNVRTVNSSTAKSAPLEVRAAWMLSFWNPYTSALVPEPLRVEVTGLPTISVINEADVTGVPVTRFSLPSVYARSGTALRMSLPWDAETIPEGAPAEDRHSWLPGRVYTWRSIEDTTKDTVPEDGYVARFNTRSFTASGETNQGVQRSIAEGATVDGDASSHLEVTGTGRLRIALYVKRSDSWVRIAQFSSPQFLSEFSTDPHQFSAKTYQFGYQFRLAEGLDATDGSPGWLTTPGRDFRQPRVSADSYRFINGDNPAAYANQLTDFMIFNPDRLLDRASNSWSYNEDVPVFELPRGPLLSLGALQHFRLFASRPFMIGNPWGVTTALNNIPVGELFDRFFFSGVTEGITPSTTATGDLILPNPLLKSLRNVDGSKPTVDDVRATIAGTAGSTDTTTTATPPADTTTAGTTPDVPPTETPADDDTPDETPTTGTPSAPSLPGSRSSKFFVQGGAFNLNSVNVAAWTAVLRSIRFPAPQSFTYLDSKVATGTAEDGATATVQSSDAQFFRFSQSAQETYKADAGSASGEETTSAANTHLFRRGMRTLTATQVAALAAKMVDLIGVKHAAADPAGGPFRSLEEFLSPSPLFAGVDADGNAGAARSLLEAAIADAGINSDIAEFSSQWLTQADVMTALGPILFARSDTFVIRSYGEAVNPATNATEGRAWCEAIVQRVPEYFDRSDPPETLPDAFNAPSNPDDATSSPTQAHQLNQLYGRRFKVVSFRWLTRSDI